VLRFLGAVERVTRGGRGRVGFFLAPRDGVGVKLAPPLEDCALVEGLASFPLDWVIIEELASGWM